MNTDFRKIFSILAKIIKAVFVAPFALGFTVAGVWYLSGKLPVFYTLVAEKVYAFSYIFKELFLGLFMLALAFLLWRIIFSKKLAKLPLSKVTMVTGAVLAGAVAFTIIDEAVVEDFTYYSYPSYITGWPSQTVTDTFECDYSQDTVYLSGYFNFVESGFRDNRNIQVVYNEKLTDSYRVEIIYKGKESEMNIHHMDYMMKDEGRYMDSISIWPVDYDYEMSAEDVAHMYRHGHDLRYAEPLVIEKITIRTAFPEKFDLSDINS